MNRMTKGEKQAKEYYQSKGWLVLKPSWPDFIMINPQTREVQMVEVKSWGDRLSSKQLDCFKWLQWAGFIIKVAFIPPWPKGEIKERLLDDNLNTERIGRRRRIRMFSAVKEEKKGEWRDFLETEKKPEKLIPAPIPNPAVDKVYLPGKIKFTQEDEKVIESTIIGREKEINEFLTLIPKPSSNLEKDEGST